MLLHTYVRACTDLKQDGSRGELGEVYTNKDHLPTGGLDDVLLARARLASSLGRSKNLIRLPLGHLCKTKEDKTKLCTRAAISTATLSH